MMGLGIDRSRDGHVDETIHRQRSVCVYIYIYADMPRYRQIDVCRHIHLHLQTGIEKRRQSALVGSL